MAKPTIIIVSAAMHSSAHYDALTHAFNSMGYSVVCDRLPSLDPEEGTSPTVAEDVEHLRRTSVLPELERGREVIVMGHSYGGCVGPAAAKGLSSSERLADGKKGGVVGIVNMSAAIVAGGTSLLSIFPGGKIPAGLVANKASGTFMVENTKGYYKGVSPAASDEAASRLRPHALSIFKTPVPAGAWADAAFDGRRAYIKTMADEAVGPEAQQAMLAARGVAWRVLELADAGHFPNMTHGDQVARFVDELAMEWTGVKG
ncbi:alpha/beta hydrolase family domain-containing protein [Purpureocillium lilacinum]|uniref:Alpha/beta hydrolase family domain-containing protein n=1 Tax=Purpureocillium lilacinum TaxID=33203 RepID=A0A179HLN0_PURLI|nr:alpha/beta hydrolase family domain-containing protein [Purpureocillium lilacinum]OAQ91207.1 alpha/beta hydrolase family domain-containing protein [Purpureocillium lilacinum]